MKQILIFMMLMISASLYSQDGEYVFDEADLSIQWVDEPHNSETQGVNLDPSVQGALMVNAVMTEPIHQHYTDPYLIDIVWMQDGKMMTIKDGKEYYLELKAVDEVDIEVAQETTPTSINEMLQVYIDYKVQQFANENTCLPYDYDELYNAYKALQYLKIKKDKYDFVSKEDLEELFNYSHNSSVSFRIERTWERDNGWIDVLIFDPVPNTTGKDLFSN